MTDAWLLLTVAGALVLAAVVTCAVLVGVRRGQLRAVRALSAELAEARVDADRLKEQLAALERRMSSAPRQQEFVITDVGSHPVGAPTTEPALSEAAPTVEPRLFADIVLRESTIRAASLVHGLRRALAPETRNRIRFEMRREVKRARKQRRAEMKAAHREWQARQRAGGDPDPDEDLQEGSAA